MNLIDYKLAFKSLKSGLPVIFPTDTLPAIGCLPNFSNIIYEYKKRDKNKPLILMGSNHNQLLEYVHESGKKDYENIASKYWPGALTIIIPCSKKKTHALTSRDFTLGMRIPNSNIAKSLMKETGPLLTSSANVSGLTGSLTAKGVALDFPSLDVLGPVPWNNSSGKASTIISLEKNQEWKIIRQGEVSIKEFH